MEVSFYEGAHSVIFGEKHSWEDWHLIPASKPIISFPEVKTKEVDIPGANGILDLSTILTGFPVYSNRTGSLEFILAPGYSDWVSTKNEISSYLHGCTMKVYLVDEPGFYYQGMLWINEFKSEQSYNSIVINYNFSPFKRSTRLSSEGWEWDPFNFETDYIPEETDKITINGTYTLTIDDCIEPVMPEIVSNASMELNHTYHKNGKTITDTYQLTSGVSRSIFSIKPGENVLRFIGNGIITIRYRRGIL